MLYEFHKARKVRDKALQVISDTRRDVPHKVFTLLNLQRRKLRRVRDIPHDVISDSHGIVPHIHLEVDVISNHKKAQMSTDLKATLSRAEGWKRS